MAAGELSLSELSTETVTAATVSPNAWDGSESTQWVKGSGTAEDPYLIESAANLAYLRDQVNAGQAANSTNLGQYSGVYFKQTADINLSDVAWAPIGVYSSSANARAFSGHYDGGGHAIRGLKVNQAGATGSTSTVGTGAGLFAYVKGSSTARASIENLVVEGTVAQTASGNYYVAGLAGYASYTDIRNCGNEATVSNAGQPTAGITGNCYYSTIEGCYNHGEITSTYAYASYAAGIAGQAANNSNFNTSVTNCYNTGHVSSSYYAGGIVSQLYCGSTSAAHTLENCYNVGAISSTATSGNYAGIAGGIVGCISNGGSTYASAQKMTNCFSLANVAPQPLIGNSQPTYMTIANSGERTDDYMKSSDLVSELGGKFIRGADYAVLYWEAPDGIPSIDSETLSNAAYVKGTTNVASLSIMASGDSGHGNLVYQWYKASKSDLSDATAIAGATDNTYTPSADTIGDTYYYCTVHNDVQALDGSGPYLVQSGTAHVQVWSGADAVVPTITSQPTGIDEVGQTAAVGNELTVTAQLAGADENDENAELGYQWQVSSSQDGTFDNVEGATEATFAASTAQVGTKYYRCVVTTTRERQSRASTTSVVVSVTVVGLTISTQEELKAFAAAVDEGSDFANCTVTVGADITVTGSWNPIGVGSTNQKEWKPFCGELNGAGHSITFAADDATSTHYALFGATGANAEIHDLVIKGEIASTGTVVAGVVAQATGTTSLNRVGNEAAITSGTTTAASSTAGLVGLVSNGTLTVTECYNKGSIKASGTRNAGLVGNVAGSTGTSATIKVVSSYNTGAVISSNSSYAYIAGIVGNASSPTISNTYNTGTISTPNSTKTASGAIYGGSTLTNPAGDNVSYWLESSCARGLGSTSAITGLVSKTENEFADETTNAGVLALLKVGDYSSSWKAGSLLGLDDQGGALQKSPALSWEPEPKQAPATHTVTFNAGEGTLSGDATAVVEEGGAVAKPEDPKGADDCHQFVEWQLNGVAYDFSTAVTDDITLAAAYDESHEWNGGAVTTEPTIGAEGVRTYTCTRNSSHTKTEAIAKVVPASLIAAVTTAQKAKEGVATSEDGADIAAEIQYTTAAEKAALEGAITAAQETIGKSSSTQAQVDTALANLTSAVEAYDKAKKPGKKKASTEPTTNPAVQPTTDDPTTEPKTQPAKEPAITPAPTPAPEPAKTGIEIGRAETADVGKTAATVKATSATEVAYVAPKSKAAKTISVPNAVTVNGKQYKVTSIAAKAFQNSKAQTITVGNNVTKIGANAFRNAKKLRSLTLGKKVKTIGKNSLKGAKKLSKITLKSSKLTRSSFRNLLKGSKVKTVKLKNVSKKAKKNYKKWAKAYKVKVR